jgi:mRNA interferase HigB
MHIISRKAVVEFAEQHPDASQPLDGWYRIFKQINFQNLNQVRTFFPHADLVSRPDGEFIIFNVGGNKYRLVTRIFFSWNKVFVHRVMTHKEYDKWS